MKMPLARQLWEQISHGDKEHQKWLLEACEAFFDGHEVPEPRGSETKDRMYKEIKRLEAEIAKLRVDYENS